MDVRTTWVRLLLGAGCVMTLGCGEVPKRTPDGGGSNTDDSGQNTLCTASAALRCEGNTLVSCNGDGSAEVETACALRCNSTALACEDKVAPSNGYAAQLDLAASEPALNITANTTVDEADFSAQAGTLMVGNATVKATVVPGANGGPSVLVLSVGSLTVASGATLYLVYPDPPGSNPDAHRPIAIMSAGDVSIAGTIFLYPDGITPTDSCVGTTTTAAGADNDYPGGGGGGFGTMGALGGQIFQIANGGNGGPAGGTDTLVPLRGGCRGGSSAAFASAPGNGGGAIQITSATKITISGKIGAPALGGNVSGGGGAGGGILLEAPTLSLTGGLYANGGAGGCGDYFDDSANAGKLEMSPAVRDCATLDGGNGGYGTTAPTAGQTKTNTSGSSDYGAGGGGAVGRIRINTLDMTITGSGEQSPPASLGVLGGR